jgi:hypothetical protein
MLQIELLFFIFVRLFCWFFESTLFFEWTGTGSASVRPFLAHTFVHISIVHYTTCIVFVCWFVLVSHFELQPAQAGAGQAPAASFRQSHSSPIENNSHWSCVACQ